MRNIKRPRIAMYLSQFHLCSLKLYKTLTTPQSSILYWSLISVVSQQISIALNISFSFVTLESVKTATQFIDSVKEFFSEEALSMGCSIFSCISYVFCIVAGNSGKKMSNAKYFTVYLIWMVFGLIIEYLPSGNSVLFIDSYLTDRSVITILDGILVRLE